MWTEGDSMGFDTPGAGPQGSGRGRNPPTGDHQLVFFSHFPEEWDCFLGISREIP